VGETTTVGLTVGDTSTVGLTTGETSGEVVIAGIILVEADGEVETSGDTTGLTTVVTAGVTTGLTVTFGSNVVILSKSSL
jgi:hypothetical protein